MPILVIHCENPFDSYRRSERAKAVKNAVKSKFCLVNFACAVY